METELETMIVRLVGDSTEYEGMLSGAEDATQSTMSSIKGMADEVEIAGSSIKEVGQAMKGAGQEAGNMGGHLNDVATVTQGTVDVVARMDRSVRSLRNALIAGVAAYASFRGIMAITKDFTNQEDAERKLQSILEANGREVESLMSRYGRFSAEIQRTTVMADENALGLLRVAETYDVIGEAAEGAVSKALALAGAVDGTAESAGSYMRMAVALQRGDIKLAMQFARMVPQLRRIKDETEFVAKAQKLMEGGMKVVEGETSTFSGSLKQLGNSVSDVMEEVGKLIASALAPVIAKVKEVTTWIQNMTAESKAIVVQIIAWTAAFIPLTATLAGVIAVTKFLLGGITGITVGLVMSTVKLVVNTATWTIWTIAVTAAKVVSTAVSVVWGIMTAVLTAANLKMILYTASIVLYTSFVTLAKVFSLLFSGSLLAMVASLILSTAKFIVGAAILVVWIAVMAVANIKTLLFKAAVLLAAVSLVILNIAVHTSIVSVLSLVAAFAVLIIGIQFLLTAAIAPFLLAAGAIVGVVVGVYQGIKAVVGILREGFPTRSLAQITVMFKEWGGILKSAFEAFTSGDLPRAWGILQAGFKLAVEQVKALWPPLWEFIKGGFAAAWGVITANFKLAFATSLQEVLMGLNQQSRAFALAMGFDAVKGLERIIRKAGPEVAEASADLARHMNKGFKVVETDPIKDARKELQGIQADMGGFLGLGLGMKGVEDSVKKLGIGINKNMVDPVKEAVKEVAKFDAALAGSAEALARAEEFRNRIAAQFPGEAKQPNANELLAAKLGAGGVFANRALEMEGLDRREPFPGLAQMPERPADQKMLALLLGIEQHLAKIAANPQVEVEGAGFD